MRVLRLGALFGSLVLLVATLVSLLNHRSSLYSDQDTRVSSAAIVATNSIQNTVLRARAVVEVASGQALPADLLRTFDAAAEACVGDVCSGPDLAQYSEFGSAAASVAAGESLAVVDTASESVLIVGRNGDEVVSIQLPHNALVGPLAVASISSFGTEFEVATSGSDERVRVADIHNVGGQRVMVDQVVDPLDSGSIVVTSRVPNNVGWGGESPGFFALLFALGTVLLALAAWTFLSENRRLERQATTDELTGLVNRREFERMGHEALDMGARFRTGVCVMLIDLNDFKRINDTRGHQFGDLVLQACSRRLVDAVRETDVVGRWGGDEFVVLLPGLEEASGVRGSAERINSLLSSTPVVEGVSISASIGAALFPRHGATLDELLQAADVAMYEAKTTGVVHRLAETPASGSGAKHTGKDRRKPMPSQIDT